MRREIVIPAIEPGEPMTDEAFQAVVKAAADDAVRYIDEEVAPDREAATAYYRGDPLGNEEEGRSEIVMTEVRDVVQAILPSLLRVFCGSDQVGEFQPRLATKVEEAEQATDYVNYIFYVDNPGFSILFSAFKDALVRKTGIVKWYVEEKTKIEEADYDGLTAEQLQALMNADDVEVIKYEQEDGPEDDETGEGNVGEEMQTEPLFEARIRRYYDEKCFRVCVVPPEEFLIARDARSEDDASYIGHRRELPIADIVAMGYDLDEVLENAGASSGFELNTEATTRNPALYPQVTEAASGDPLMRKVLYTESFIRVDKDGDGIAERRRVCSIGNAYYVLHEEVWDDMVPFAIFCPDPEPHMAIGYSIADQVADLQEIKTNVVRNTLDSLAQTIHPRMVVVETAVNMDDVLNTETGSIIRARAPGMVQAFSEPFVGQQAMPIIDYFDQIKAARTGITAASQGLDPDVLQSTTKAAVTAMTQASEQRLELIARIFAETGMKRIMRGLLRLIIRHQDRERLVRLRGKFVPVNPQYWDAEMDVAISVGLGTGNAQDRLAALNLISQKQEQIIQMTGPLNPLCTIMELRNTYADMAKISGVKNVERYFRSPTMEEISQYQQEQQPPPAPDPTEMLAQVEAEKTRADIVNNDKKVALEFIKARMQDDRERDKLDADVELRAAEMQARVGAQVNMAQIKADMERQRTLDNAAIAAIQTGQQQEAQQAQQQAQQQMQQPDPNQQQVPQ